MLKNQLHERRGRLWGTDKMEIRLLSMEVKGLTIPRTIIREMCVKLFENVEINGQKGLYCMLMSIDFSFKQSFINFQPDRLTNYFLSANIKPTVSLQTIGGCRFHACGKRSGRT